jgi:DinB family protein
VAGLSEEQGTGRAEAGSWSVAECLDHLATANRVYLRAMEEPATRARTRGRYRWRPARNVRAFLGAHADLDLAGVRFPNPFVRGIYFSLATGLHVIAAHERRHLWQAGRVRRAMDRAAE